MSRDIAVAEDFLEGLLEDFDHGPKLERVSEEMAEEKIRFEIGKMEGDKQQAGLWSIHKTLLDHGVPPSVRLHLISAVVNLSLVAKERRAQR